MSTLLKDLIDIPETAGASDYVLRLTDGVEHQDRTLQEYVVTDELTKAFATALDLIRGALSENQSKAAFLDGSFGSGKSHFMAVLYSILGGNPAARAIEELAPVIDRSADVLENKKLLTLAYHFLAAESVEDVILGGYVAQIRKLHPGCPLPAVHETDLILADADAARGRDGDEAFFAALGTATQHDAGDEWGEVLGSNNWDAVSYEAARQAPEGDPQRTDLVDAYRQVFQKHSAELHRNYRPLPDGLAAISSHAKQLGYDGIVLFCDEIILWLTFIVSNHTKFGEEVQKLTQLVETGSGTRDIPIISILARQLNLQQYFGDNAGVAGNEQQALESAFRHQEGRFSRIELGEHNLPQVAHKRLLKPKNAEAQRIIDEALQRVARNVEVRDVLLDSVNADEDHRGSSLAEFNLTYPFSPALISTLQDLSGVMQRDRTALKVMQRLLVDQRDTLTVDNIIPVGDLFDLLMGGSDPITSAAAAKFANAKRLYDTKFQPMLRRDHDIDQAGADVVLDRSHPYWTDARLAKTLVLSALAPNVPALANITPARIASLNHGSIVSPVEKRIPSLMLGKLKKWTTDVPELRVPADTTHPVIRLGLSEVDYDSVLIAARGEDNPGRRRELLRVLICQAFGIRIDDQTIAQTYEQTKIWRGTNRTISLLFANVCDTAAIADSQFESPPDQWLYIIDYPFDESGRTHRDDLERVVAVQQKIPDTNTITWLPKFFSLDRLTDLGRLVVCNYVLKNDQRWETYAKQLSGNDRHEARRLIENQRDSLTERITNTITEAYGISEPTPGSLVMDGTHEEFLKSLNPEVTLHKPVGVTMAQAFDRLIEDSYDRLYPGHPRYSRKWNERDFSVVADNMRKAAQDSDGRHALLRAEREATSDIVNTLKVGHVSETDILLTRPRFSSWAHIFDLNMGRNHLSERDTITVGDARKWVRDVHPAQGLTKPSVDLVIIAWTLLNERSFYRAGMPLLPVPNPGKLSDDMTLVRESLPTQQSWSEAVDRAGAIFGLNANSYMTPTAVNQLVAELRAKTKEQEEAARLLVAAVEDAYDRLGIASGNRLKTAHAAADLITGCLKYDSRVDVIEAVVESAVPTSTQAMSRSLSTAAGLTQQFGRMDWGNIESAVRSDDSEAKRILSSVEDALMQDEFARPLGGALSSAASDLSDWLRKLAFRPTPGPKDMPEPQPKPKFPDADQQVFSGVLSTEDRDRALVELREFISARPGKRFTIHIQVDE